MTKTPEVSWHDATCRFRVLAEAIDFIAAPAVERQGLAGYVMHGEMPVDSGYTLTLNPVAEGKYTKPLYTAQPAPVSVDAAKAFGKGFNTLEQAGGKYRINMQFANHDDAWAAYTALSKMTASLAKPQ